MELMCRDAVLHRRGYLIFSIRGERRSGSSTVKSVLHVVTYLSPCLCIERLLLSHGRDIGGIRSRTGVPRPIRPCGRVADAFNENGAAMAFGLAVDNFLLSSSGMVELCSPLSGFDADWSDLAESRCHNGEVASGQNSDLPC